METDIKVSAQRISALTTEMDAYLQAYSELRLFSGSVIVVTEGQPMFAQGYGMASLEYQVSFGDGAYQD